ncbi:MAG: helix-turn-helix transcriptional regulator [Acidobacteriota bacterium]
MVDIGIGPPAQERNAGRPTSKRQRMWRAIRQLRRFDLGQLMIATEVSPRAVWEFTNGLRRTGYLVKRQKLHFLIRDSGPKPPRLRTNGRPYFRLIGAEDRNTGERYGADRGPEPAPMKRRRKPGLNDRSQLRAARALLDLSRVQLARRARVARSTIGRLEPGEGLFVQRRRAVVKLERALTAAGIEFLQGDGWSGVALRLHVDKRSVNKRPASNSRRIGMPQATTREKVDLMKQFQEYAEREIRSGRPPAAKRFFETLCVPFAVSARSINHWYRIYRKEGEQGLKPAERPPRKTVFQKHPELAAEVLRILAARRSISAERLRGQLRLRLPEIDISKRMVQKHMAQLRHDRIIDPLAKAKNRYLR